MCASLVLFLLCLVLYYLLPTEYGALKPKRREGGGDLASRLHLSKAVRHDTKDGNNWKSVSDQEPALPHEHTETESPMVQMTRL